MKKRLLSLLLVLAVVFSFSLSAFATDTGIDIIDDPLSYYFENQLLGVQKGTGVTLVCPNGDYSTLYTGGTLVSCPYDGEALVLASAGGVQAKPYQTGGGSAGTGGVGRNPSGYSGTGVPSVAANGEIQYTVYPELGASQAEVAAYPTSFVASNGDSGGLLKVAINGLTCNVTSTFTSSNYLRLSIACRYSFTTPVAGRYYLAEDQKFLTNVLRTSTSSFGYYSIGKFKVNSNYSAGKSIVLGFYGADFYATKSIPSYTAYFHPIVINCIPTTTNINNYNKITINNNTWNGNIYQDNSTNLTYIYPQYTTINESNETVTNISNNPIIYNNTTNQYYTYDTVTNNYYYITYEAPTPSPSPDPDPTPTPEPGGDTGDTSGIMKILQEIKAVLVSGFAGITEKLQNIGVGGSTPESGKPGSSSGGQSWWDKLLGKIGDAIVDGLLGAISAVLKLIFKLFTTILGWIIWLVSQVLTLFPFLPPGLGALLIGGVVVCFIIGLIKFIRG